MNNYQICVMQKDPNIFAQCFKNSDGTFGLQMPLYSPRRWKYWILQKLVKKFLSFFFSEICNHTNEIIIDLSYKLISTIIASLFSVIVSLFCCKDKGYFTSLPLTKPFTLCCIVVNNKCCNLQWWEADECNCWQIIEDQNEHFLLNIFTLQNFQTWLLHSCWPYKYLSWLQFRKYRTFQQKTIQLYTYTKMTEQSKCCYSIGMPVIY